MLLGMAQTVHFALHATKLPTLSTAGTTQHAGSTAVITSSGAYLSGGTSYRGGDDALAALTMAHTSPWVLQADVLSTLHLRACQELYRLVLRACKEVYLNVSCLTDVPAALPAGFAAAGALMRDTSFLFVRAPPVLLQSLRTSSSSSMTTSVVSARRLQW